MALTLSNTFQLSEGKLECIILKWYLEAILVYPLAESNQRRRVLECLYFYIWCHDGLFVMFPAAIRQRELRLLSKSVWRVFILHNVMNGLSMPLIINGFIKPAGTLGVIFTPTNEGIFTSILFGVAGWMLYQYRIRNIPRQ